MQHILILGAGKSATILIEHLLKEAVDHDLFIHVADGQVSIAEAKLKGHPRGQAYAVNPSDGPALDALISQADLVISMLPPPFHAQVIRACIALKKQFLNASYLTEEIAALKKEAEEAGLTMICEMGLDPGIDHMSAMEMLDDIRQKGGVITRFRSHCGGLISPESDNNPWHYKISWNPRNIVMAGSDGAQYLEDGAQVFVPYNQLFSPEQRVEVPGAGSWCWYANRDSLAYIRTYGLDGVQDFVRTTLRHPDFCHGWKQVVDLGLTQPVPVMDTTGITTRSFFQKFISAQPDKLLSDPVTRQQFSFLGMDKDEQLPPGQHSPVDIMQWILERKLALDEADKDMIIMLHEISYQLDGRVFTEKASLMVKGTSQHHTAMAKTVGLPLAIAALLITSGKLRKPGISIPIHREIYEQVLPALAANGISFTYSS